MRTPLIVVAGRDEFLGHQIHAVVQTADEAQIGGTEIFVYRARFVVLDLEYDGRRTAAIKTRVDAGGHFPHLYLVMLVFLDAGTRRCGNLDEREATDPFRIELQQAFDGTKALHDALGVIEAVDADTQLVLCRKIVQLPYVCCGSSERAFAPSQVPAARQWKSDSGARQ